MWTTLYGLGIVPAKVPKRCLRLAEEPCPIRSKAAARVAALRRFDAPAAIQTTLNGLEAAVAGGAILSDSSPRAVRGLRDSGSGIITHPGNDADGLR